MSNKKELLRKVVKKLIKEAMEEDAHKIAGQLSVYAKSIGANAAKIRFEDTKTAESIDVQLDRKSVIEIVKALMDSVGVKTSDIAVTETTGATPIGESRYSENAKQFAAEFYKRAHEQAGLPNWDSRHWQILCGLYDEFTKTHAESMQKEQTMADSLRSQQSTGKVQKNLAEYSVAKFIVDLKKCDLKSEVVIWVGDTPYAVTKVSPDNYNTTSISTKPHG